MLKLILLISAFFLTYCELSHAEMPKQSVEISSENSELLQLNAEYMENIDLSQFFLLDIRHQETFAAQHIQSSVSIPLGASFSGWSALFIPQDASIILIANTNAEAADAAKQLHVNGCSNIAGYLIAGEELFQLPENRLSSFPMISGPDFLNQYPYALIVDVRTDAEWASGHIPGAMHYELNTILQKLDQLPTDRPIGFICGSGYRSSIATSLVQKAGFDNVINIKGGMKAWILAGLPVEY